MREKNRHFHSIIVHSVVGFSLLALFSYFCNYFAIDFLMMGEKEWRFLNFLSLLIVFITALPATVSGVFETNKMYARWHKTHKMKLLFSLCLLADAFLCLYWESEFYGSLIYTVVLLANVLLTFLLSYYGLKITLGRQSFGKTSYVPDFFNKENPIDIVEEVREYIQEKPKRIDFFEMGEE